MYKRHIKGKDVEVNNHGDYSYQRYVTNDEDTSFNFLVIKVDGVHGYWEVVAGVRNYHITAGVGTFSVGEDTIHVEKGDHIVIQPGERYSYAGQMEMIEFNIDQGDGIEHRDIT